MQIGVGEASSGPGSAAEAEAGYAAAGATESAARISNMVSEALILIRMAAPLLHPKLNGGCVNVGSTGAGDSEGVVLRLRHPIAATASHYAADDPGQRERQ